MSRRVAAGPGIIMVPVLAVAVFVGVKVMGSSGGSPAKAMHSAAPVSSAPAPASTTHPARPVGSAPKAHVSATINAIERSAHADIGQSLWAETVWAPYTQNGNLGCAAAESVVLRQAEVKIAGSDNVRALANQLVKAGWEKIPITSESQMREGDVIYGSNSELDSHIGIVGSTTNGVWIYDNNSDTGLWGYHPIGAGYRDFVPGYRFKAGHLWVLRYQG